MTPLGPKKKDKTPEIKLKTDLFNAVAALRVALKLGPCKDQMWVHDVGDWKFAVNGYPKHQNVSPINCDHARIPPYSMVFWYKGQYVGWCNPNFAIIGEEYNRFDGSKEFDVTDLEKLIKEEINKVK